MNIDELKLIVDLVKELSGSTTSLAVWWIAGHYLSSILTTLIICTSVAAALIYTAKLIASTSTWATRARTLSQLYGGRGDEFFCAQDSLAIEKIH